MTGKIMKGIAGFYYVHDGISGVYECKAKGIFRNKKIKPLVGDDVEFTILDEEEKTGNIVDILDRENELIRPAVANIDQAMVVFAATAPEPNLNLLDRFLVTMESQDVPVVICFNKKDLVTEEEAKRLTSIYEAAGYEVHLTNAKSGEGIEQIRSLLRGKTTVLAGPSGVGKSTITNEIQPEAEMETGTISEKIKRGKHTTRHSELFFVETDTFVMDTPGFSSMFVDNMKPEELQQFFPEFEEFIPDCRFLGCVHVGERECGVKDAVKEGTLSKERYEN
ncbi:MAG: ribosome small subunit-dependent GTPase A, partial [Lachnospiraceae bacterium]|nr:ribosome small subunit-dependent GTPase A [Lachnospiraceae bacterium]